MIYDRTRLERIVMNILKNIKLSELIPLIDKKWLFTGLWQLKGDTEEGERLLKEHIVKIADYKYEPKIVYEIFDAKYEDSELKLKGFTFKFKDDLFQKFTKSRKVKDKVAILSATVGKKVIDVSAKIQKAGNYHDYFCIYGLSAALAEAATEYGHRKICEELGKKYEETFGISPGYPVWPEISDQKAISKLISLKKIGVSVSETNLLIPEFSTTAAVFITT